MLTLGILIEALTGRAATAYTHTALTRQVLTDAVIDSRLAIPGCLFVALRGERTDGHEFVTDAFERGAAGAVLEGRRVIGIPGSVGKSTTKELVASVLASHGATLSSESSFNNEIGLPLTLLKATRAHRYAVLEMGFYVPGDVALLCDIAAPQVGVVTMIGPVHLERAGSLEAIVMGKAELVQALTEGGVTGLNADHG